MVHDENIGTGVKKASCTSLKVKGRGRARLSKCEVTSVGCRLLPPAPCRSGEKRQVLQTPSAAGVHEKTRLWLLQSPP